jgi:predicted kinase
MKLFLIRGLPGSGKSTFAKTLGVPVFEADDWFVSPAGEYLFSKEELPLAHNYCMGRTVLALASGSDVAVSNTFTQKWEMRDYLELAKQLGATVVVYKCISQYENIHGVPKDKVAKMASRWEDIEGEILVGGVDDLRAESVV